MNWITAGYGASCLVIYGIRDTMSMYTAWMKEHSRGGRPRSDQAREAVLQAVDDLLLEEGYAGMTMKGIAARAGVSRQTVYRWWSTKAEILLEASASDAAQELATAPAATPLEDLTSYLDALVQFLASSPAGAAYRALLGEAQHDPAVAALIATRDVLGESAKVVIDRITGPDHPARPRDLETSLLIGPVFFWILSGRPPEHLVTRDLAETYLRELRR